MNEDGTQAARTRWSLVLGVTLVGALVVAAPFAFSILDMEFGTWRSLTSATLTNLGTSLFLAAVLVWLERRFVARVEKSTRRAVAEESKQLRQENAHIRQRLVDLEATVAERSAAAEAEGDGVARTIVSDVSFETVTRAFELANDVDALWRGSLAVPINDSVDAPALRTSWEWANRGPRFDSEEGWVPTLMLRLSTVERQSGRLTEVEWQADSSAADVLHELKEKMIKNGLGEAARTLDSRYVFERLARGVRDAIAGRRSAAGAWLSECGELYELVGDNLAITSLGIAAGTAGLILRSEQFPERPNGLAPAVEHPPPDPLSSLKSAVPLGVNPEHWAVALTRGAYLHPRQGFLAALSGTIALGVPITSQDSPVQRES